MKEKFMVAMVAVVVLMTVIFLNGCYSSEEDLYSEEELTARVVRGVGFGDIVGPKLERTVQVFEKSGDPDKKTLARLVRLELSKDDRLRRIEEFSKLAEKHLKKWEELRK